MILLLSQLPASGAASSPYRCLWRRGLAMIVLAPSTVSSNRLCTPHAAPSHPTVTLSTPSFQQPPPPLLVLCPAGLNTYLYAITTTTRDTHPGHACLHHAHASKPQDLSPPIPSQGPSPNAPPSPPLHLPPASRRAGLVGLRGASSGGARRRRRSCRAARRGAGRCRA